jgi:hypothetical protein
MMAMEKRVSVMKQRMGIFMSVEKIVLVLRLDDEGSGNDFHEDCNCSALFCSDILYRISTEFDPNYEI